MGFGRALAAIALIALVAAGCGGQAGPPTLTVGSLPDADSRLNAHLYAAALRYYGTATHIESTPDPLSGLDSGALDVVPGYTGRLLYRFQPDAVARADTQVYRAMVAALPEGVSAGDYAMSAADKPAAVLTEATADAWGGRDVAVVADHCDDVRSGATAGSTPPKELGVCELPAPREFPDAATLFAALAAGQVNVAWSSTADPDVPAELVVLSDRTALVPAENLVPLYRRNELTEGQVLAINEVAGVLDTAALVEMRRQVADGADPGLVADAWLAENPLRH